MKAISSMARRCVEGVDSTKITLSSTCVRCSFRNPAEEDVPQIMILIASDDPIKSPLLTIASQCIAARMRVVVVRVLHSNEDDNDNMELMLERRITSTIPCDIEPLLSFQYVSVEDIITNMALNSPYDALSKAEAVYDALSRKLMEAGVLPDIMVVCYSCAQSVLVCVHPSHSISSHFQLEAANVGAQLVAEKYGIRNVLLAPGTMLNIVSEKTLPSSGIFDLIKRRKDSFFLADRFMQMNKVYTYTCLLVVSPFVSLIHRSLRVLHYSFVKNLSFHCFDVLRITLRKQHLFSSTNCQCLVRTLCYHSMLN